MAETTFFDSKAFGRMIREARKIKGIANIKQFADEIKAATDYEIKVETIKNIEIGRKMPTIQEVMAISLTLDGTLTGGDTEKAIRLSACRRWRDADNETLFKFAADALEEHERLTREIEHTHEWNTYIQEKLLKVQKEYETVVLFGGATDEQIEKAEKAFIQRMDAIQREIDLGPNAWRAMR